MVTVHQGNSKQKHLTKWAAKFNYKMHGVRSQYCLLNKLGTGYIDRVIPSVARNLKISPCGRNDSMEGVDVKNITHPPKANGIVSGLWS